MADIDMEIIVVDNNSADGSVAWLQEKFSWVRFICNKENIGYGRANNQGWHAAKGDYILFLNPDTIITEDCLEKSIAVLRQNAQTGALGIHMIDGTGHFLPESKRGFPSPAVSFFKLTGLVKLFPRSRKMARYYLGWLPADKNNDIDVLSGAYMMVKRAVLEKTGGFDEQFFMYGEDIDLSYRIRQAGFTNYYLGENRIVHFKGESTKKNIRYTKMFYTAMDIYVQKHYGKSPGSVLLIRVAITVRGAWAYVTRFFEHKRQAALPPGITYTILAGAPEGTAEAAAILQGQPDAKRKITVAQDITGIYNSIESGRTDEIIFCAGTMPYTVMISCMENLAGKNIAFRFFAPGSNSIVSSASKNNSGEVITGTRAGVEEVLKKKKGPE